MVITLIVAVIIASVGAVSAGWFGEDSSSNDDDKIPMKTQNFEGILKISAPVGSNFKYEGEIGDGHFSIKNTGEYDADVMAIIYTPYEFESSTGNDFYEKDGNLTVYVDSQIKRVYFVDRIIDGNTISLEGSNLDLLKEMANSVELP